MRAGLLWGAAAYALWGASALYWPLLRPAGAPEILAIRIICSALALTLLVTALRQWPDCRALVRHRHGVQLLGAAALLITVNWGTFIYATTNGRVIEASLGYFLSPLVMVLLGTLLFRERPRRAQWLAVLLGALAAAVAVGAHGRPPTIAIMLAATFGLYAVIRKRTGAGAVAGLTMETLILLPPALAYAVGIQITGAAAFGQVSLPHSLLMAGASLVMLAPLLLFGVAANRAPLSSLGLLQYIEPTVQFGIGLFVFAESMPTARWLAFTLVWLAVVVLGYDARRSGRDRRAYWPRTEPATPLVGSGSSNPTAIRSTNSNCRRSRSSSGGETV